MIIGSKRITVMQEYEKCCGQIKGFSAISSVQPIRRLVHYNCFKGLKADNTHTSKINVVRKVPVILFYSLSLFVNIFRSLL